MYEYLRSAIHSECEQKLVEDVQRIESKTSPKDFAPHQFDSSWFQNKFRAGKMDIAECKKVLTREATVRRKKYEAQQLERLDSAEKADQLNELTLTITWTRGGVYGSQAQCVLNGAGYIEGERTGGCGYDKESTAVASCVNQCFPFLKLLYQAKEDGKKLPYGSGYGILPYFEGGTGISCLESIAETIGKRFECVADGKTFDVYRIY